MAIPDDAAIATGIRRWIDLLSRGNREERALLLELVEEAERSGFPAALAASSLAQLPPRTLWKTFDPDELQDLYDIASEAELATAAERFYAAALARPYIDSGKIPQDVFDLVMERDGHRCQECGTTEDLTIDHKLIPWSEGGSSTDPANLQVLCRPCNSSKGTHSWVAPVGQDDA
jgi:hypothetical protein